MSAGAWVAIVLVLLLILCPAALLDMAQTDPDSLPEDIVAQLTLAEADAPPSNAVWTCPVKYTHIASPYGWRYHPIDGTYSHHSGVDLSAAMYTPVYATRAGTVVTAAYNDSGGNFVIISHGEGFDSRYLHMSYFIVSAGQHVEKGQVIGYVGSTGASTGPHLHFMICYGGRTVDPGSYAYLPQDGSLAFTEPPRETDPAPGHADFIELE